MSGGGMKAMSAGEIAEAMAGIPGWELEGRELKRSFRFGSFMEAIRFVNGAAEAAEELGHHPDMDIRYSKVLVGLTTHDAGGLTELDFRLAGRLGEIASHS